MTRPSTAARSRGSSTVGEGERGMGDSRLGTGFSRSYRSRTMGRSDDRPRLPTGTVTFLFTDIEGSTRLLQDLGDRYGAMRDEHAAILRRAIRDGGGVEVSTEGDSFLAAFASPAGALRSAVAARLEPVGRLVRHLRHVFSRSWPLRTAGGRWAGRPGSLPPSGWTAMPPGRALCPGRCRGTAASPGRRPRGRPTG